MVLVLVPTLCSDVIGRVCEVKCAVVWYCGITDN